jgi:hypothetical protein
MAELEQVKEEDKDQAGAAIEGVEEEERWRRRVEFGRTSLPEPMSLGMTC